MREHQRLLVGLDEAGRGSLLGPLVVGAYSAEGDLSEVGAALTGIGVRDSKCLTPARREALYGQLKLLGHVATAGASPPLIDRYVARGGLNWLEIELMADLVVRLKAHHVYVDACDVDETRFGRRLEAMARQKGFKATVLSRHKADRDIPLVGAASIVAKVTRDRAMRRLAERNGTDIGSGYPSDPVTRACVRRLLDEGKNPPWVRRSWSTLGTLKKGLGLRTLEEYQ